MIQSVLAAVFLVIGTAMLGFSIGTNAGTLLRKHTP